MCKQLEAFDKLIEARPVIVPLEERMSLMAGNSGDTDPDPEDDPVTPEQENLNNVLAHFGGE